VHNSTVKTFWRIVPLHGPAVLGLWEWGDINNFPYQAYESDWKRHVCVYRSLPAQEDPACPAVAADQFYSLIVKDSAEFPCLNCKTKPNPGDQVILIAMHITTKEVPDWVWATFWWRGLDRTNGGEWYNDNAQRPDNLKGFWTNYSMNTTLSLYNRDQSTETRDSAMFNPYIEGASEGTDSNCLRCHNQARIAESPQFRRELELEFLEGTLRTDFLWSLAFKLKHTR
jgi:hypothetical protein